MRLLIDTYKNTGSIHHAYLLEGERDAMRAGLLHFLKETLRFAVQGNPDFWTGEYENFGIDEARALRDMQLRKSFEVSEKGKHGRKIFIISTTTITHEAQNSLLKSFEEPTPGTHFFLLMPSSELLLPTLRSRMVIVRKESDEKKTNHGRVEASELVRDFLKVSKAERLKLLEEIIENKDKTKAADFLGELERELHAKIPIEKMTAGERKRLHDLLKIKSYIYDRSASIKMILEYCALVAPVLE